MTIGDLARKAGVKGRTVCYYEQEGLLPKAYRWPDSSYRDFDDESFQRLRFIRPAKGLGFTLREIKELLDMRIVCRDRKNVRPKLTDIDLRMEEMRPMHRALVKMAETCRGRGASQDCPTLWELEQ